MQDSEPAVNHKEMGSEEAQGLDIALEPNGAFSGPVELEEDQPTPQPSQAEGFATWQAELADRVQEYRQRRARLRDGEKASYETPDFDFGPSGSDLEATRPNLIEFPSVKEAGQHPDSAPEAQSDSPAFGLENFEASGPNHSGEASSEAGIKTESHGETGPLEIEFGSSIKDSSPGIGEGELSAVPIAPMRMRFLAGVIDALVLLSGTVVYGLIFSWVGGRLSLQPLELAVTALIAVFFTLLYFGGCTALASATPGLMWAGLEVCTFEGNTPKLADSLWRAFGYLVSTSALLLGFIWAAVDADGLTWHDRMSRTLIVPAEHR